MHGKARIVGYVLQSAAPTGRAESLGLYGAYHQSSPHTVPLCLVGCEGPPGIAELCSVASRVAS